MTFTQPYTPASSSRAISIPQSLDMVPEEDSEMDDSQFETLPLDNLQKKTRPRRSFPARPLSRKARIIQALRRLFCGVVFFLGTFKLASLTWNTLVYLFPDDLDARLDGWLVPGGRPSIFSHWTTHGVEPVHCHSHNDYWREVPLYSALRAGCIGVEADIWPSNHDLLVGHTPFTLHADITLRRLYLDPLLDLLQKHNTRSSQLQPAHRGSHPPAGVFATDPAQTLVLLIDFKTAGEELWEPVQAQLQPLRAGGFLSYYNGTAVVERPVTVVATGDVPFHRLVANTTYRDVFYDAPLDQLEGTPPRASGGRVEDSLPASLDGDDDYTRANSYYASVDFRRTIGSLAGNRFSEAQLARVRAQVAAAHARGLKVRYWGTPGWPRGLRNHVWHVLVREGVDLINVDDLYESTRQDWRKHRSWGL
ncbi:hypothetical protein ASPACDRAFT_51268 [Aspergillus aculeatus ATCC 16872]|uniref:Altered inheritance of mitochondria protein 6 n=1 Tax=Aspergillus aculeatus (strain ATCC 16872 / CBS 172.66 / WB 5094) TaxID=690307 RepID=A0A1L9WYP8_ASPA1|nr:uncharacterized protein ASPACDRAFT_51268 [Aspergillus aculeatus ATCC 16872]OJK01395.1 hypothetical protein ASPACDRAFT_51268 [Aspergillus aculeatus ATCC 16872]